MKILKTAKYEKLAGYGTFKYKCDSCGEFTHLTKKDRNIAAIPRCRYCGSTWLEPVTENAKDKMKNTYKAYNERVDLEKNRRDILNKRERI
jgi:DNA-directed RNA polymerase subunit RPC12/RpoP